MEDGLIGYDQQIEDMYHPENNYFNNSNPDEDIDTD